jgi:nitric oxide reductase activation protein
VPVVLGCMVGMPLQGRAQQDTQQPLGSGVPQPHPGTARPEQVDAMGVHMEHQMAERRNDERQRQLVADTDKLLSLAQELKAEVDKSNKDQLSLDVVKRAEQIEKLAKSVKEKMKGY